MIVNVCGFGWSGSGAYLDLLKEYEEVCLPSDEDWEFNLLWAPDGIYDLEQKLCTKHCRIFDSDLAINRFLDNAKIYGDKNRVFRYDSLFKKPFYISCKEYIDSLVQFEFEAHCFLHNLHPNKKDQFVHYYNKILSKLFRNRLSINIGGNFLYDYLYRETSHKMYVSYTPENFLGSTQDFLDNLFSQLRKDKSKILVLNQSVSPDMPHLFDKYFKEKHKTIVVRRDPRDTYLTIKKLTGKPMCVPQTVDEFIFFYKKTIADTKLPDSDTLLSLNFEDLMYDYDSTVAKIENFLGLNNHVFKEYYFKPQISINNTQLKDLYPQYSKDILKIEIELADQLYHFDDQKFKRTSTRIF